ncbi:MAG TPA: hypothetical protein VGG45_20085 [Terracidiphilus sp.]
MRIGSLIVQYLLALIFIVFGMNHYLNFISMGQMPTGTAGQFIAALVASHYMYVVAFFEVAPAILLLINRFVPLSLVILAPVIFNILLTNLLMAPQGLAMGLFLVILWLLSAWRVRTAFFPLLQDRPVATPVVTHARAA